MEMRRVTTTIDAVVDFVDALWEHLRSDPRSRRALVAAAIVAVLVACLALLSCNGLPPIGEDRDGDGVPDAIDQCPDEPGPLENLGCPVIPPAPYDCENPPALSGFVSVRGPIREQFIVVGKPSFPAVAVYLEKKFSGVKRLSEGVFSARIETKDLAAVVSDPRVQYVQQDGRKRIVALSWGLDRVDQRDRSLDGVFAPGGDGAGIHVYVNDTGVTRTADLGARLSDDCFSTIVFRGCEDGHGHGTHVAGTVAGTTWGVAKAAVVHSVRFLDEQGSGSDSDAIRTLDWMAAHDPGGPGVVNASWGGDPAPAVDAAVCRVIASGKVFVAAAGNSSEDVHGSSPARVKQALTVGASDRDDRQAYFSNFGPGLDLYAPGVDIESDRPDGGTQTLSGTSMAAPHVAGGAALYRQRHPAAGPADVAVGLVAAASEGKLSGIGPGSPNLLLYVREDAPPPPPPPPPPPTSCTLRLDGDPVMDINNHPAGSRNYDATPKLRNAERCTEVGFPGRQTCPVAQEGDPQRWPCEQELMGGDRPDWGIQNATGGLTIVLADDWFGRLVGEGTGEIRACYPNGRACSAWLFVDTATLGGASGKVCNGADTRCTTVAR